MYTCKLALDIIPRNTVRFRHVQPAGFPVTMLPLAMLSVKMVTTTGKVFWPSQIHTNWMAGSTFLRISLRKYDDIF